MNIAQRLGDACKVGAAGHICWQEQDMHQKQDRREAWQHGAGVAWKSVLGDEPCAGKDASLRTGGQSAHDPRTDPESCRALPPPPPAVHRPSHVTRFSSPRG
eukprot:300673-Prymnesium_polylepis.1